MAQAVKYKNIQKENLVKSKEAGRPIFEDKLYCEMIMEGGSMIQMPATDEFLNNKFRNRQVKKNEINTQDPLGDAEARMHERAYSSWEKSEEVALEGTPLEEWPAIKRTEVEEVKRLGIFTVEQMAEATARFVERYGNRGSILKKMASQFLEAANDVSKVAEEARLLKEENGKLKIQLSGKEKEIADLRAMLSTPDKDKPKK